MNRTQLIADLLNDFDNHIEINLKFGNDDIEIYSCFTQKLEYSNNIQSKTWVGEGYLKIISTFFAILSDNQILIRSNFKLSDTHKIDTIKDACYYNMREALSNFLSKI